MRLERPYWHEWAQLLQRLAIRDLAAAWLETAGPINLLLAQILYLGQPFIQPALRGGRFQALAAMLENQQECRLFAGYLREEGQG
jgi:hypothetical protein